MNYSDIINGLSTFLSSNLYHKNKKCFYNLKNSIAYCVSFECPSNLLYTNFYIIPLYIPTEVHYMTYGNRLESFSDYRIQPLNVSSSDDENSAWVTSVKKVLEQEVFPFFELIDSPNSLATYLINNNRHVIEKHLFCTPYQYYKLCAFTNFALLNHDETNVYLNYSLSELAKCSYYSRSVKERENRMLLDLNQINDLSMDVRKSFLSETITNTIKTCF